MRRVIVAVFFLWVITPSYAQTRVSVAQLEQFLRSGKVSRNSDAQLAELLGAVTLTEQLTPSTLAGILRSTNLGPESTEQLQLLASTSMFEAPPPAELPKASPPDPAAQHQMLTSAEKYVSNVLQALPDFLAVRATFSFDNALSSSGKNYAKKQVATLHFLGETRRTIAFRNSREITSAAASSSPVFGLTTWGEFGPILKIVLSDSFNGSVAWKRWQTSESGIRVAVFRYAVPKSASHYLVDFCCYVISQDNPVSFPSRDHPAYHGDLYIDPETGIVDRITLQAELSESDPVTASDIAVQYGQIDIGGKSYVCPVQGVAISTVHNLQMKAFDGIGLEKHVNVIRFQDYHKFGSTARIFAADPRLDPH